MSSKLSHRLSFIYNHTPLNTVIYDIGCDHGDLGLSFLDRPEVQSLYFVDASLEVISRLKSKIKEADIPKAIKILHDNVQTLKINSQTCTVLMCGFGGQQIIEGIENLIVQMHEDSVLVLSPHRDYFKLRQYLFVKELELIHDLVVEERGHFYPLIVVAARKGEALDYYGHNLWHSSDGKDFREYLVNRLKNHQNPVDRAFFQYLETLKA